MLQAAEPDRYLTGVRPAPQPPRDRRLRALLAQSGAARHPQNRRQTIDDGWSRHPIPRSQTKAGALRDEFAGISLPVTPPGAAMARALSVWCAPRAETWARRE